MHKIIVVGTIEDYKKLAVAGTLRGKVDHDDSFPPGAATHFTVRDQDHALDFHVIVPGAGDDPLAKLCYSHQPRIGEQVRVQGYLAGTEVAEVIATAVEFEEA